MQSRRLGKSSLIVSEIGLGCMGMSEFYGVTDEAESIATIHGAIDLGVTLLDTANVYGLGRNEELLGRAIAGRRNEIILATKFGIVRDDDGRAFGVNGRPEYAEQSCEASLRRLRVPSIDLYYLHRVDPSVPIEDTVGAMARLVEQGKVRYLGLSEAGAKTVRRAHAIHPIAALQNEYSLWTHDPEQEILGVCRELGISLVAYSPLGRGFLTGQIRRFEDFAPDDYRRHSPRFQGDNFQKNLELVERIEEIARAKNCTAGQLALAWVLGQGQDIVPIPGTKRRKYLEENLGAADVSLTPADLARIREATPGDSVSGARYPEALMKRVGL